MKKGSLIVILLVLALFCFIAMAVGGFFGWRWYKNRAAGAEPPAVTATEEAPAQPMEPEQASPEATSPTEVETPAMEPPAETPAEPQPEMEQAPPSPAPTPAPARRPAAPKPAPKPAPTQEAAPTPAQPAPEVQERPAAVPAPAETPAVKVKTPKGRLGLIFESRIDQGQVTVSIDGEAAVSQPFTASESNRFRLTKEFVLAPGQHKVKVEVTYPDGKTVEREWPVMVVEGSQVIWKAEANRFPKSVEVKPIS